jgi:uncharacterized phiE125 gp8 family phage protein
MELKQIIAPASGVVTMDDARDHLRITSAAEDATIAQFVATASAYLDARDGILGDALVTQTWRLSLDQPAEVTLPIEPVQSIAAIKYLDPAGVEQTYSAADYRLSGSRVELVDGASWPVVANRSNAFWIDFLAGYGAAEAVPETARMTALLMIGEMYKAREMGAEQPTSDAFKMLLSASRSSRGLF